MMRRGMVLIFALGVLTLLAVLGMVFAAFVRVESVASANRLDAIRAELLASSAVTRTVAELVQAAGTYPYDTAQEPWIYKDAAGNMLHGRSLGDVVKQFSKKNDILDPNVPLPYRGHLGGSYTKGGDQYAAKVIDCAAQINLNQQQPPEALGRMLTALGAAISADPNVGNGVDPIAGLNYRDPSDGKMKYKGEAILAFRQGLLAHRFSSKTQLLELFQLSENPSDPDADTKAFRKYRMVADFVTANSYENERAIVGSLSTNPDARGFDKFSYETHAPINVNTAPKPVLVAALQGLAGRFRYPYVGEFSEENLYKDAGGMYNPVQWKEATKYDVGMIYVYIPPLSHNQASRIADEIIKRRTGTPFRSLADWEYFVDYVLAQSVFSGKNSAVLPQRAKVGSSWTNVDRSRVLTWDHSADCFERYWNQAVRDVLKANFNPNARPTCFNTDAGARLLVSKADLLYPRNAQGTSYQETSPLNAAYSTEWCYNSMGYFEITALGRLLGDDKGNVVSEREKRTVICLGGCVTHSSQHEFESTDDQLKEDIVSFPEPMQYWKSNDPDFKGDNVIGFFTIGHYDDRWYDTAQNPLLGIRFEDSVDGDPKMSTWPNAVHGSNPEKNGYTNAETSGLASTNTNDLMPDGFYTSMTRGSKVKILRYRAALAKDRPDWTDAINGEDFNGACNIHPYKAAVEFWFKPDFDYDAPVLSAFAGATFRINRTFPPDGSGGNKPRTYFGGTQFFLIKSESGMLRASLFYYELFYDNNSKLTPEVKFKDQDPEAWRWWPPYPQNRKLWEPDPGKPLPETPNKHCKSARVDLIIPKSTLEQYRVAWRRGEWHHIVVTYNHESTNESASQPSGILRLCIDGVTIPVQARRFPPPGSSVVDFSDCIIANAIAPTDALFLCGLWRNQRYRQVGFFKFERSTNILNLPGNATFDEVYVSRTPSRNFEQNPSRFLLHAEYENTITVPYPPGCDRIIIRGVETAAYAPTKYAGQDTRGIDPSTGGMTTCRSIYAKGLVPGVRVGLRLPNGQPVPFGSPIQRPAGGALVLTYNASLDPIVPGSFQSKAVLTPVFDSITVHYLYPKHQTILYEEVVSE